MTSDERDEIFSLFELEHDYHRVPLSAGYPAEYSSQGALSRDNLLSF